MLTVLTFTLSSTSTTQSVLNDQYYSSLADDAAQSGINMAKACEGDGQGDWALPLRPGGDCAGAAAQCTAANCYVVKDDAIRTTFSVSVASDGLIISTGKTELLRKSDGSVWKTISKDIRQQAQYTLAGGGAPSGGDSRLLQRQLSGSGGCDLTTDNQVHCWGDNPYGQLGIGSVELDLNYTPAIMPTGVNFTQIAGNRWNYCAVGTDKKIYCWGKGGTSSMLQDNRLQPTLISSPAGVEFTQVTVGRDFGCAVASSKVVYCWGQSDVYQTGRNNTNISWSAVSVTMPTGILFDQVAAGDYNACAVATVGTVYCWGGGTGANQRRPSLVSGQPSTVIFSKVQTGLGSACALDTVGEIYCWGLNGSGAGMLGDGSNTNRATIGKITMPTGAVFKDIALSSQHTCASTTVGAAYCWGINSDGQLGNGSTTNARSPVAVTIPSGVQVASFTTNDVATCAVTTDAASQVLCWGLDDVGTQHIRTALWRINGVSNLTPVGAMLAGERLSSRIATGSDFSCAISAQLNLYCWGLNTYGQLGIGSTVSKNSPQPVAVPAGDKLIGVRAGGSHACGVSAAGDLYCWGRNNYGQLGDGTTTDRHAPVKLSIPGGERFTQVESGANHSCAYTSNQREYCWGRNDYGQLGDGTTTDRHTPILSTSTNMGSEISVGDNFSCHIRYEFFFSTKCWGRNDVGQAANSMAGTTVLTPTFISGLPSDRVPFRLVSGGSHSCILTNEKFSFFGGMDYKNIFCWGGNSNGQLGIGNTTNQSQPRQITSLENKFIAEITAGGSHTCAMQEYPNDKFFCWGDNSQGQLGIGNTTSSTTPQVVSGLENKRVYQIEAGNEHSCALAFGDIVYCWGDNDNGQVGDGTYVDRLAPTAINLPPVSVAPTGQILY